MICYAVIDTNVIISALLTSHDDAATVKVINKIFDGEVVPIFSDEILNEYNDVLRRKKFGFSSEYVTALMGVFEKYGEKIVPNHTGEVLPDIKDIPFYEVVADKESDGAYLVTGNIKHFPKKPFIVTAREFIDILEYNI